MKLLGDYARAKRFNKILKHVNFEDVVLDLGCGKDMCNTKKLRTLGFNCIGVDLNGGDVVADARCLPFEDNFFDTVLAIEVLEHVDCVKEICRVLKPNGWLIATTPNPALDWIIHVFEGLGLIYPNVTPHNNLLRLKDLPMKLIKFDWMFFHITQFGVLAND